MVLSRLQDLVGNPNEIVNKAHFDDKLMETTELASARQTLQILVKYLRPMKDLLKEIEKLLPPQGTPQRILDPGVSGSPTAAIYEVVGEVELIPTSQTMAGPGQVAGTSRQKEPARDPERTRSTPRRKWTEPLARLKRVQSPIAERARTPKRAKTSKRTKTLDRGRAPSVHAP